jgi:hypothetical protein
MPGLYCGWSTIQLKCQASAVAGVIFNLNARTLLRLEYYSFEMPGLCCGWSTIQLKCQASAVAGVLINLNARTLLRLEYYSV